MKKKALKEQLESFSNRLVTVEEGVSALHEKTYTVRNQADSLIRESSNMKVKFDAVEMRLNQAINATLPSPPAPYAVDKLRIDLTIAEKELRELILHRTSGKQLDQASLTALQETLNHLEAKIKEHEVKFNAVGERFDLHRKDLENLNDRLKKNEERAVDNEVRIISIVSRINVLENGMTDSVLSESDHDRLESIQSHAQVATNLWVTRGPQHPDFTNAMQTLSNLVKIP
jgi:predicted  nucleic acid-binding Zn-ribbon protein